MQVTDDTFQQHVLSEPGVVLVDFWASWCPPCKMMEPLVERLHTEYAGRAKIVGINIDRNPRTAQEYKISNVPTFVTFADGRLIESCSGALTENQLRSMIEAGKEKCNVSVQTEATQVVTIVSGLPRSGTSMMMKMLEAGGLPVLTDETRRADDDNPNGYYEYEAVKKTAEDASWLKAAEGKAVKMVYRLLRDLPSDHHYRVVFMRRNIHEILASQRAMLERNGNPVEISDERLAVLFSRELQDFERWIETRANFSALHISFNQLLKDPSSQVALLNRFLGGALDAAAMECVVDPSLYRQRAA